MSLFQSHSFKGEFIKASCLLKMPIAHKPLNLLIPARTKPKETGLFTKFTGCNEGF